MKRSRVYTLAVSLLLVGLIVTACATPKTVSVPTPTSLSCPTTAPLSCPTSAPLSCPTTALQAIPEMNAWRKSFSPDSNVVITFDKGDKCSMMVKNPLTSPEINYEIIVNDTTYQNYMLRAGILDPGKTLADLETWTSVNSAPPYSQGVGIDVVSPGSSTALSHSIALTGQLYGHRRRRNKSRGWKAL